MEELCWEMVWPVLLLSLFGGLEVCYIGNCVEGSLEINGLTLSRNGGELAEGWYDSATLRKAQASAAKSAHVEHLRASQNDRLNRENIENAGESSDESTVGPALPSKTTGSYKLGTRSGPVIPSLQDLDLQRGKFCYIRTAH